MIAKWSDGKDSIEVAGDSAFVAWAYQEFFALRKDLAQRAIYQEAERRRSALMDEHCAVSRSLTNAKIRLRDIENALRSRA